LTYNWYLRKDVKWSDGKPLTSEDWLWTFQQVANPDNKYPYKSSTVDPIAEITAPEPYRLVVKLKEALVVGLEQADPPNPLPKHVWEKVDWNDPAKNPELAKPSVVSGMFKLKEWRRDDFAEFEANDLYWQGRPLLDGIQVRIVPDPTVSYQMLKGGEVDSGIVQPNDSAGAKANPLLELYPYGPNTRKNRAPIAVRAQQAYADIGVEVAIPGMGWAAYLQVLQNPPCNWDLNVGGWAATIELHWKVQIWSEASIAQLNSLNYVH